MSALLPVESAFAQALPAPAPPSDPTAPAEPPSPPPADSPPAEDQAADGADEGAAAEEEAVVEEDEDPRRPPKPGKGVLWGVVRSKDNNETLIEAQVSVVGTKIRALTDVEGRFRLELSPGTYELRVFYELHKARRVQNAVVVAGKVQQLDVTLDPDKAAIEEVDAVEADVQRGSTATQFMLRRNSAVAQDAIGAQEIARTPDRNAADAAKRVVGATIVDSRYVYVRGLGERYTNALLNGTPLPSPEPDRQAVPLDIFPAAILSDITILKTMTPDMPGDFAGGSVVVHTRDFPSKFTFQATVNGGFNTNTTLANRLTLPESSKTDWLGMDSGKRGFPEGFPNERIVDITPEGDRIDVTPYGRAINSGMAPKSTTSLPNFGGNLVIGDTFRFGADKKQSLGYQAALSYSRTYFRRYNETIRTYAPGDAGGSPRRLNDYRAETGTERTQWSAFGSIGYAFGNNHRLTLTGVLTRTGDMEGRRIFGFNEERATDIEDARLRFTSRGLIMGQLRGEHKFPSLGNGQLTWSGSLARATMDDPNLRNNVYILDPTTGTPSWEETSLSGLHFYAKQTERTIGGTLDWLQPIVEGKKPTSIKFGGLLQRRDRDFNARRLVFRHVPGNPAEVYQQPPDRLFSDANIGSAIFLDEQTRPGDAYTADYDVTAAYMMADTALHERVRVVMGPRVERSVQTIDTFDQFVPDAPRISNRLARTDILPSANVILKVTDNTNLRLSGSRTVARPQLRELAPFIFADYFGGRDVQGNPDLDRTRIWNGDLRYEWFPGITDVIAVSLFYKHFDKPIEPVIVFAGSRGTLTFENADSARNIGAEFEVRKGLGFIAPQAPVIPDLTAMFNLTLVDSSVKVRQDSSTVHTSDERPLANQSPWIVNAAIDYTNDKSGTRLRLLYNVFGPRIAQVGAFGLPDVYERPRHLLDFTAAQRIGKPIDVRLTVENLLNSPYRFFHGTSDDSAPVNRYTIGTTAMLYVTYSNE